jgi:hypothetical protein
VRSTPRVVGARMSKPQQPAMERNSRHRHTRNATGDWSNTLFCFRCSGTNRCQLLLAGHTPTFTGTASKNRGAYYFGKCGLQNDFWPLVSSLWPAWLMFHGWTPSVEGLLERTLRTFCPWTKYIGMNLSRKICVRAYDVRHVAGISCKCCAHLPHEEQAKRDVTSV